MWNYGDNNTASKILRTWGEILGNFKISSVCGGAQGVCWWGMGEGDALAHRGQKESGALELELLVSHLLGCWELDVGPLQEQ